MNRKKAGLQGGRWYISGGTVTATANRRKFSSSFFLKKMSGVHYATFVLFFPCNGKVNARHSMMKTSITEHLEQQQQTRQLFSLATNKKKNDTATFQGGSNSSLIHPVSFPLLLHSLKHAVVCVEKKKLHFVKWKQSGLSGESMCPPVKH